MHSITSQILMDDHGIEATEWRSRRLTLDMIASADLILTAETRHRADIVTRHPRSVQVTFPILQFAGLCELAVAAGLTLNGSMDLIQTVTTARGLMPRRTAGSDDLDDPMGQSPARFRTSARQIAESMNSVVRLLATRNDLIPEPRSGGAASDGGVGPVGRTPAAPSSAPRVGVVHRSIG